MRVLGYLMGVLGYLMGVLGYLMGVLGYPMAWRRGPHSWPRSRSAPLSSSQAPHGHGLAPPPPSHGKISKWKRPVNGNAICWAPVSEPGFLKFRIFIFSILEIIFYWETFWKHMLVRYRGINNKGVLERPWTKWRVLRAISTTLKCQFTGNC